MYTRATGITSARAPIIASAVVVAGVGRAAVASPVALPPSSSVLRSSLAVIPGGGSSSETAQRLVHSLRVGSDLAPVQGVNRVLAVVEAGEDRGELVGGAAVPTEQTLPHARDVEARIGSRVGGRDHAGPVEVIRHRIHGAAG